MPKELGQALGFTIYRTGLLLRPHLIRSLKKWQLTPEQWQTLATLTHHKRAMSQTELCSVTLTDKHAFSKMIDRMAKNGWVERIADSNDGRSKLILATAKSKREIPEIILTLKKAFKPIWEQVPEKDQKMTAKVCAQLFKILN